MMQRVLITGAKGFIGRNLTAHLRRMEDVELYLYDIDSDEADLKAWLGQADVVFHLAGINRPKNVEEFETGNAGFTHQICDTLRELGRKPKIVMSSSIQAELDNPYGVSKKAAEAAVFAYGRETGVPVFVFRLPNVFGKWCRPHYNSAVATFCHNIAHDLPIQVNDSNVLMNLVYIDDVVSSFISALDGVLTAENNFCGVEPVHSIKLGDLAELICSFKASRDDMSVPNMSDALAKKLYSTYLSYLPTNSFSYPLKMNVDDRGSFTEIIRTPDRGQVSVNISKPGITKGNHWHHTKNEKFLVVSGEGSIRFRKIGTDEIIKYLVSGEKLEVVDIPVGYTHDISNIGTTDLVTFMWCNEPFNPEIPDTIFEMVDSKKENC